jgi:flagellin-like hook-associated protein FlgL
MASVRFLGSLRAELDELQRQLGTGKKSNDYAGLGIHRGMTVALRSQLSALAGFKDTITHLGTRLELGQSILMRISAIGSEVRTAAQTSLFELSDTGQTVDQAAAARSLDELFALLNTRAGERYLFSGRATDTPAVAVPDLILDGDGVRAGFRQVMAERWQADLGVNGLGRLATSFADATVSIGEDAAGSPFGFKLSGISTTVSGATVSGPAGSPPSESVSFEGSSPASGDTVTLRFTLPDGTSESLVLTATTSATPAANEFTVGASGAETAANMRAALDAALGTLAQTSLRSASGMAAAKDFFDVDATRPPQRIAGPPFDTATAVTDGGSTTVSWYTGDNGTDHARGTAVARVDSSIEVAYGMRGTEEGIRSIVQAVAVFANSTFSADDPNASKAYAELQERVGAALSAAPGRQKVMDIAADLGATQATLEATKDRHVQAEATLLELLQSIEGVTLEEVGAKILALQTNLQASLQTTAILSQISLVDYL